MNTTIEQVSEQARLDRALELVPAHWTPMLQIPAWSCDLLTLADQGLIHVRRQQGQFGRYHEFRSKEQMK
jgi:hypothetical protein